MTAFDKAWGIAKGNDVECPTCGEMCSPNDIGASHIDDDLYDRTGEERWIKPKNPKQCKWCEWGSEA